VKIYVRFFYAFFWLERKKNAPNPEVDRGVSFYSFSIMTGLAK
jgi:hypothetical protein